MLFYFTGTGNCLYVARQIEEKPVSIPQAIRSETLDFSADRIGIVAPVYGHEVPQMVKAFMHRARFHTDYFYMILTYGNRHGGAVELAAQLCAECGISPSYINILNLGLRDTYWAIVLPGAISAYEVFVFRTFFSEIPSSLAESAYIDGAGHFRTLFSIILPLSKALLATFALFAIVRYWNDYMSALLYLDSSSKHPIQLFLRKILNTMRMDDIKDYAMLQELNKINSRTVQNAAIVITIVPILCVYPFLQKYFAQGVLVGSIKG